MNAEQPDNEFGGLCGVIGYAENCGEPQSI